MTKYFLIVASKDHVLRGVKQGIAQAGHGRKDFMSKPSKHLKEIGMFNILQRKTLKMEKLIKSLLHSVKLQMMNPISHAQKKCSNLIKEMLIIKSAMKSKYVL